MLYTNTVIFSLQVFRYFNLCSECFQYIKKKYVVFNAMTMCTGEWAGGYDHADWFQCSLW